MKTDTDTIAAARRAAEAVIRLAGVNPDAYPITTEKARTIVARETHLRETVQETKRAIKAMETVMRYVGMGSLIWNELATAKHNLKAHLSRLTDKETSDAGQG